MWPFTKKKSSADLAIEWMPRAIDVAAAKWVEFDAQPFAQPMDLDQKLFLFSEGLKAGLKRWKAFKDAPDPLILLIAAKGVERSRTYFRVEIEAALNFPLPKPHERTDEEEKQELMDKVVDRVARKWAYFTESLKFKDDVLLKARIEGFKIPLLEGIRADYPIFGDASDSFFDPMIALGIAQSGQHRIDEVADALGLQK